MIQNIDNLSNCPHCGTSWKGDPIPDEYFVHDKTTETHLKWYKPASVSRYTGREIPEWCPCLPYGDLAPEDRFFGRVIGIELPYDHPNHYDGVSYWFCPDCGSYFDRWTGERVTTMDQDGNYLL